MEIGPCKEEMKAIPSDLAGAGTSLQAPSDDELPAVDENRSSSEKPAAMLDVHALHEAIHTWKAFFIHIATIVIGLLIAVGLEQTVEAIHWREKVQQARESLHAETTNNGKYFVLRQATRECVSKRLTMLRKVVDAVAAHHPVEPIGNTNPSVGLPLADALWQSEQASQTLTHFPRDELGKISIVYASLESLRRWQAWELTAYSNIKVIEGDPGRLAPADLALLRQNIEMAETMNSYITGVSLKQLKQFKSLGIEIPVVDPSWVADACTPISRTAITHDQAAS